MLFTPWLYKKTESYAQAHVIVVRNGYVTARSPPRKAAARAPSPHHLRPNVADVADEQWPRLLGGLKVRLGEKLKPDAAAASVATSGSPSLAAP